METATIRIAFMKGGFPRAPWRYSVQDGTQIKVECVYAEVNDPRPGGGHETYSIFVVDRSGHDSEIKEWPATPNKQMRPSGTTPLRASQIADLEIRQSDTNEVLLRAPLR